MTATLELFAPYLSAAWAPLPWAAAIAALVHSRRRLARNALTRVLFVGGLALACVLAYASVSAGAQPANAAMVFGLGLLGSAAALRLASRLVPTSPAAGRASRGTAASAGPRNPGPRSASEDALSRLQRSKAQAEDIEARPSAQGASRANPPAAASSRSAVSAAPDAAKATGSPLLSLEQHLWVLSPEGRTRRAFVAQVLAQVRERGAKAVVADPAGELLHTLGAADSAVLNPADERSLWWFINHEEPALWEPAALAALLTQSAQSALRLQPQHVGAAQELLVAMLRALHTRSARSGSRSSQHTREQAQLFVRVLGRGGREQVAAYLEEAGEPLLVSQHALAQLQGALQDMLALLEAAPAEAADTAQAPFSATAWLRSPTPGVLFLTYHDSAQAAFARLAFDAVLRCALEMRGPRAEGPAGGVWFCAENYPELGRVVLLETNVRKMKKRSLWWAAGFENWGVASDLYSGAELQNLSEAVEAKIFAGALSQSQAADAALVLAPAPAAASRTLPGQLALPAAARPGPQARALTQSLAEMPANAALLVGEAGAAQPCPVPALPTPGLGAPQAWQPIRVAQPAAAPAPAASATPQPSPCAVSAQERDLLFAAVEQPAVPLPDFAPDTPTPGEPAPDLPASSSASPDLSGDLETSLPPSRPRPLFADNFEELLDPDYEASAPAPAPRPALHTLDLSASSAFGAKTLAADKLFASQAAAHVTVAQASVKAPEPSTAAVRASEAPRPPEQRPLEAKVVEAKTAEPTPARLAQVPVATMNTKSASILPAQGALRQRGLSAFDCKNDSSLALQLPSCALNVQPEQNPLAAKPAHKDSRGSGQPRTPAKPVARKPGRGGQGGAAMGKDELLGLLR
jgi:hypothetical protein